MVAVQPGMPRLGVLDKQFREIGHRASLRCGRETRTQAKRFAVGIERHRPPSNSGSEVRLAGSDRAEPRDRPCGETGHDAEHSHPHQSRRTLRPQSRPSATVANVASATSQRAAGAKATAPSTTRLRRATRASAGLAPLPPTARPAAHRSRPPRWRGRPLRRLPARQRWLLSELGGQTSQSGCAVRQPPARTASGTPGARTRSPGAERTERSSAATCPVTG